MVGGRGLSTWCSNAVKVDRLGSPDVELLMLRHPYYLPREFVSVCFFFLLLLCSFHSVQTKKNALQELYDVISWNMTKQPDGIVIVAG